LSISKIKKTIKQSKLKFLSLIKIKTIFLNLFFLIFALSFIKMPLKLIDLHFDLKKKKRLQIGSWIR